MAQSDISSLVNELKTIHNLSGNQLLSKFQNICSSKRPGLDFMDKLGDSERDTVHKCCLLLSTVTVGKKIPREFQLEATLALCASQDSLIHAATGSGKTLCMVLPALKRLQVLQVS